MQQSKQEDVRERAAELVARSAAVVERARELRAANQAGREQRVRAAVLAYRKALEARYARSAE
jgi:hypothetical protein